VVGDGSLFFFAGGLLALLLAPFFLSTSLFLLVDLYESVSTVETPEISVESVGVLHLFAVGLAVGCRLLFRVAGVVLQTRRSSASMSESSNGRNTNKKTKTIDLGAQHDARGTEKAERAR